MCLYLSLLLSSFNTSPLFIQALQAVDHLHNQETSSMPNEHGIFWIAGQQVNDILTYTAQEIKTTLLKQNTGIPSCFHRCQAAFPGSFSSATASTIEECYPSSFSRRLSQGPS